MKRTLHSLALALALLLALSGCVKAAPALPAESTSVSASVEEPLPEESAEASAPAEDIPDESAPPAEEPVPETHGPDWYAAEHVYSHRGASGYEVEHTFASYDLAIELGSHYIEQDLVSSKDGTLYVSHDETAERIAGVSRSFAEMTDAEISQLRTANGEGIHTMAEVFDRYGDSVNYLIELKTGGPQLEAFAQLIWDYDMADRVIVQCFMADPLRVLEEQFPEMKKLLLCRTQEDLNYGLTLDYADIICVKYTLMTRENCDAVHQSGKEFCAYWSGGAPEDIRGAIELGLDSYFTNYTDTAIRLELQHRREAEPLTTLFLASDFQQLEGWPAPADTLSGLLDRVYADGREPDNAILCGDYTNLEKLYNYETSPADSIAQIRSLFSAHSESWQEEDMIFVQGNHDALTDDLSATGLHEFDQYLVYVLNTQNDYPWKQGVLGLESVVRQAAEEMDACFRQLIEAGETRPIFIAGHVPLHFSGRTSPLHTTGDNLYASLIFNVVNEAAQQLNCVYLFGHNHSKGWDSYLGGSCVYRGVGDTLLVPAWEPGAVNTSSYTTETLSFTYLNAGYLGYFSDGGSDRTLTCTVCEIYDDQLLLFRYDQDGVHPLGSDGAANPFADDRAMIPAERYSVRVESPQIVPLH